MHILLKSIPVPLSGLMLGVAALAKLFFLMELNVLANILFVIGAIFFTLLLLKAVCTFKDVVVDLQNPVIASVAPTFTMGTMVLTSILMLENVLVDVAQIIWAVAAVMQFMLIGFFVMTHMVKAKLSLQSVFPSWFVTFVGIGMIPATAPAFAQPYMMDFVYVALIAFVIILPFVVARVFVLNDIPTPAQPLITILAAPASLCLVAYLAAVEEPNATVVTFLLVLAQALYVIVLAKVVKLIQLPFYPSFGAFTFPLVVSATALYNVASGTAWFEFLAYFEIAIATIVVLFVTYKYIRFLYGSYKQAITVQSSKPSSQSRT